MIMLWTMATGSSSPFIFSTWFQLISLLWLSLALLAPVCAQNQNRSDEISALQIFISQNFVTPGGFMRGGHWVTWNFSDENACAWVGVTCTSNFTVSELDFSGWDINSLRFEPLSHLRDLQHLDLSSNNVGISGEDGSNGLSPDIGTLTGLTYLDLSNNNLNGVVPANISNCRLLRFLSFQQNKFRYVLPSTLSNLKDMQFLVLAQNNLSGPFPTQLTGLSNVVGIDLSQNSFSGNIPALPNLTKLTSLRLDNNSFTKFEDSWFSTVSESLQVLTVSFNQLEDILPSKITVRDFLIFNMTGNRLSGPIPSFSKSRYYGFSVDLSQNQLTGEIPTDLFFTNSSCISLNLSYNLLTGNVPFNGASGNCFEMLDLSHNNLSGRLPSNIFTFTAINKLWLGNNQLSGDFVEILNITNEQSISELRLENNLFTGELSNLTELAVAFLSAAKVLDFTNNRFRWSVLPGIADPITTTLSRLNASGVRTVVEFRAGGNDFSGTPLPSTCFFTEMHQDYSLQVLDLSSSHLQGEILSTAFNNFNKTCLTALQFLNLSNNDIVGVVPDTVAELPSLQVLDVSNNYLTGHLPFFLSTTNLKDPRFFEGNHGLCGYPLPSCPKDIQGIQRWVLLIIIGGSVTIAMGSCLITTWKLRVYHRRHQQDEDLIKTLMERESATLMPLRELKKATDNFAESAQIGEGGFGTVYIGKLNNGTMVAIKRSKHEGSVKDKERFLNEVRILSLISHRNLVKLLGCCMENKIAVLVFEYIPNGTLQEHLSAKVGATRLTWKQRLNIAMQTADGLNYLHSGVVFPIYHRDVKSANILLDDNFNAKVADFGVSKLAPIQATHVSTIAIQGTMGYIDPEYYTSCQLSDKSDVYSFGVVLLELISAKPALDLRRRGDNTSLVYLASQYIEREDLAGLIDPALIETYHDVVGYGMKSILGFSKLAMKCLDMQSKARPSMSEVLKELQILWRELVGKPRPLEHSIYEEDIEDLYRDCKGILSEVSSQDSWHAN